MKVVPAYIKNLQKQADDAKTLEEGRTPEEVRFDEWWASLPKATRVRPYSMSEITKALGGMAASKVSPILVARGWTRKRKWSGTVHYYRLWVPPQE